MLKQITVEFHEGKVEITRWNSITKKEEKFFALVTIGISKKANPTELDFCEQALSDWKNPRKPISLITFETHHGIQSATR
tara:strand:- start:301 stop:540 length:240 start_codon:yes stop_codon:yes gene_type:complete